MPYSVTRIEIPTSGILHKTYSATSFETVITGTCNATWVGKAPNSQMLPFFWDVPPGHCVIDSRLSVATYLVSSPRVSRKAEIRLPTDAALYPSRKEPVRSNKLKVAS